MAKYGGTPTHFHPKISLSKMTQNSLKWILNTTFKKLTFFLNPSLVSNFSKAFYYCTIST